MCCFVITLVTCIDFICLFKLDLCFALNSHWPQSYFIPSCIDFLCVTRLFLNDALYSHLSQGNFIQCVFFHRSSEIGLLWACFGTSGLPKGFQVTTRLGANYLLVRNIIWWVLEIFRKMIVSRKNFRISQFKHILKDVPEMISSFLFHF